MTAGLHFACEAIGHTYVGERGALAALADIPVPFARPREPRREHPEAQEIVDAVWQWLDPTSQVGD